MTNLSVETCHLTDKLHFESQWFQELVLHNRDHKKHGKAMSRKAFFAAHCTHRFYSLHWGSLSEKSNIPQCESRIRFWPCIGVRSISVSRDGVCQSRKDFSDSASFWMTCPENTHFLRTNYTSRVNCFQELVTPTFSTTSTGCKKPNNLRRVTWKLLCSSCLAISRVMATLKTPKSMIFSNLQIVPRVSSWVVN